MTIIICVRTLLTSPLIFINYPDNTQTFTMKYATMSALPFRFLMILSWSLKKLDSGEEQIALVWKQKDSDYPLWPSELSDGSIRFICLVTALLLPDPPATLIIDEPELGLHPYAINLLGGLLRSASTRMQLIVSTQSIALVNEFSIDDLIIVERENSNTVFKRYEEQAFQIWLSVTA